MHEQLGDIGFYIHWPFCTKKCYYCDLNSYVNQGINEEELFNALLIEIENWKSRFEFKASTIFFGGGTPSLMKPEWISRIIKIISGADSIFNKEITIEANPLFAEISGLYAIRQAGVNRISFGVQSFYDGVLEKIGRTHRKNDAVDAIVAAKNIFDKISIDLMYALPGCNNQHAIDSIEIATQLGIKHISMYEFTLHKNTLFGRMYHQNNLRLHNTRSIVNTYKKIIKTMQKNSLPQYEISSFAHPMHQSLHNLQYWNYKTFIGVGPGAHSRIILNDEVYAIKNYDVPDTWLQKTLSCGNGIQEYNALDYDTVCKEKLMMYMRLSEGTEYNIISELCSNFDHKLSILSDSGLVYTNNHKVKLTLKGQLVLNSILRYLLDIN